MRPVRGKNLARLLFYMKYGGTRMQRQNRKQNTGVVRQVTGMLVLAAVVYALVNTLISVLINEIIDAFALAGTAQGVMSSMLSLGMMFALLATPALQGRIGKLTMLLLAGLLQSVTLVLSGASPNFAVFAAASVLLGLGCGWLDSYMNSCMVDVHPVDSPRYMGMLHGMFGIGSLLAPLLIRAMLFFTSWRGVFYITAGVMLAAMACVFFVNRRVKRAGGVANAQESRLTARNVMDYLKKRRNLLLLAFGLFTAMTQSGVTCWIVRYMTLKFNAELLGATCITAFWICATVNRFFTPRIRMRPLTLCILGALLSAGCLLVCVLTQSALAACVMVGGVGLFSGHFMPMLLIEGAEGYQGSTTLTTSVMMLVMGAARVAIPLMMAFATNAVSVEASMLLPAGAALLGALCGFLALRVSRRTA